MTTPLQKAAQAVIDRWDAPSWKDQPHTAEYIAELRKALDAEIAQAEPVGYFYFVRDEDVWKQACDMQFKDAYTPLYLHPPQQAVPIGERAELIAGLRGSAVRLYEEDCGAFADEMIEAADMLEADAGITAKSYKHIWSNYEN